MSTNLQIPKTVAGGFVVDDRGQLREPRLRDYVARSEEDRQQESVVDAGKSLEESLQKIRAAAAALEATREELSSEEARRKYTAEHIAELTANAEREARNQVAGLQEEAGPALEAVEAQAADLDVDAQIPAAVRPPSSGSTDERLLWHYDLQAMRNHLSTCSTGQFATELRRAIGEGDLKTCAIAEQVARTRDFPADDEATEIKVGALIAGMRRELEDRIPGRAELVKSVEHSIGLARRIASASAALERGQPDPYLAIDRIHDETNSAA